jgi:hypothetical protein
MQYWTRNETLSEHTYCAERVMAHDRMGLSQTLSRPLELLETVQRPARPRS